jgi:hypothetical protein
LSRFSIIVTSITEVKRLDRHIESFWLILEQNRCQLRANQNSLEMSESYANFEKKSLKKVVKKYIFMRNCIPLNGKILHSLANFDHFGGNIGV